MAANAAWRIRLPSGARPQAVVWNSEREAVWRGTGECPAVAVWDVEHLGAFLEMVRDDRLFPLWWLMALRGLRRGEAGALRTGDLDAASRELRVSRQLLVVDGRLRVGPPKSASSVRVLALDAFTTALLGQYREAQRRRFAGTRANPAGYLFTQPDGPPVRPDWLTHRFHTLVHGSDLPPVRLHDLRHGAASLAGAAGVDLKVIQHDLGHASVVTTADTYWSVLRELAHDSVIATAALVRSHARVRLSLGSASQA